jgi:thiosulfate/3-mercaptopyruvate sulfurtransferase
MADAAETWLVETDWLAQRLDAPDLVILDGSWHLPGQERDAYQDYLQERIPGALFFDIDEITDGDSPLPHMLPGPDKFSSRMRKMGIGDGMRVVIYDSHGMFSAARVWWTFRTMGVRDVAVLDGGLPKWKSEDRPLEDGPPPHRTERHFTARRNAELVRDVGDIQEIVAGNSAQLLDARSPERFSGSTPEPREGLRAGHIPGSSNVHYAALLNADGTMKRPEQLKAIFDATGLDFAQPVVTTCGSGVTASILALALAILGHRQTAVYDGSWSEWGRNEALPLETGTGGT